MRGFFFALPCYLLHGLASIFRGFFICRLDTRKRTQKFMADVKQRKKKVMPVSPGRPKGIPNKLSGIAKDNIAEVFNKLGGVAEMALWASDNQTAFYNIYAKLLPLQVNGAGKDGEHLIKCTINLVLANGT